MAKLRNLVGCILNEFTQAQHLANNYAARLGKEYAENDLLRYFKIPNAYADGLVFKLKFAVNPTDDTETVEEINYQKLIQFFSQLAVSITETAITTTLFTSEGNIVSGLVNYRKLKEKENVLKTDFHDYLSNLLRDELAKKAINEVDKDGIADHNRIFEIAMDVIDCKFFAHPELKFSENSVETLNEIKESCSSFIGTLIERSCRRTNFKEMRTNNVLDIAVDSESLSKTPTDQIQQVEFTVNLRNYQVSRMETENGDRDCIIPANS
ncbi:MAG: hypothetical protein LBD76_07315 [Prevotellaceae bacterium]|jgi:hypothetical protein|nr:hypothetical protein [Prevotellaceae bacterium]